MNALQEFLDMGSYGVFVWPSYALSAVVLGGLLVTTLRRLRARERELSRRQAELPQRRRKTEAAHP